MSRIAATNENPFATDAKWKPYRHTKLTTSATIPIR